MREDDNITWIAYYGTYNKATGVVRVRKRSRRPKSRKKKKKANKTSSEKDTTNNVLGGMTSNNNGKERLEIRESQAEIDSLQRKMPPNTTDTSLNVHENITQCEGPSNSGKMLESSNQAKGVIPMHIQSGPTTKKVCEKMVFVLKGSFSIRNEVELMIQEFGGSVQRRSPNNTSHYLVGENMKSRDLKQEKKNKVKMVKLQHLIDFVEGKIGRDDFQ